MFSSLSSESNSSSHVAAARPVSRLPLRPIALPLEHGGWGLVAEPVFLGLLTAPSVAGLFLGVAAVFVFLARHPLKLAFTDFYRKRVSRRTNFAVRFAVLYLLAAVFLFAAAVKTSVDYRFLIPLLIAAPLALAQAAFDFIGRSRAVVAELAGPVAIAAIAPAIGLAGGLGLTIALGLWSIQIARALPTILYLRTRLRLIRQKAGASLSLVRLAHVAAVIVIGVLATFGIVPYLAVVAMIVLLVRAWVGVTGEQEKVSAKTLGIRELAFGAVTVILSVIGSALSF